MSKNFVSFVGLTFVLSLLLFSFIPSVIAQEAPLPAPPLPAPPYKWYPDITGTGFAKVIQAIIGPVSQKNENYLPIALGVKIIIFLLFITIVVEILKPIVRSPSIAWIVAILIGVLANYGIPNDWLVFFVAAWAGIAFAGVILFTFIILTKYCERLAEDNPGLATFFYVLAAGGGILSLLYLLGHGWIGYAPFALLVAGIAAFGGGLAKEIQIMSEHTKIKENLLKAKTEYSEALDTLGRAKTRYERERAAKLVTTRRESIEAIRREIWNLTAAGRKYKVIGIFFFVIALILIVSHYFGGGIPKWLELTWKWLFKK